MAGSSTVTVANSILWSADASKNIYNNATLNISYSDVQQPDGVYTGTGNKNADPQFTNAAGSDYSLSGSSSPAVEAGNNQVYWDAVNGGLPLTGAVDLAGSPRLYGTAIDMGAYEFDASSLPVRWISFEGHIGEGRLTTLRWKAEETNTQRYELERSADARLFYHLAEVPAAGRGITAYQFPDPLPVNGIAYYRIRQVDLDGAFSYSSIVSVRAAGGIALRAYPNPTREAVTVELDPAYAGSRVRLVSIAGVVLQEITVKEPVFSIPLDGYPAGMYLLHTADGKVVRMVKE